MAYPYFSIIIRFYNAEQWLAIAIESVIRQTFTQWELLLVNDCSIDDGARIATEYETKFANIRLITLEKNSGNGKKPGDVGVSLANGVFCVFLDSDDELEEKYLEKLHTQIEHSQADVALPTMTMYDSITKQYSHSITNNAFMHNEIKSGYDACALTLPTYKIGCGGMAFKKTLYKYVDDLNAFYYVDSN